MDNAGIIGRKMVLTDVTANGNGFSPGLSGQGIVGSKTRGAGVTVNTGSSVVAAKRSARDSYRLEFPAPHTPAHPRASRKWISGLRSDDARCVPRFVVARLLHLLLPQANDSSPHRKREPAALEKEIHAQSTPS